MTVTSATGIVAGETVSGPYLPSGTVVSAVSGTTLTLNQRPYNFARSARYKCIRTLDTSFRYVWSRYFDNIDTAGIAVGMRVFGSHGINTTVQAVSSGLLYLNSYGNFTDELVERTVTMTLYFIPASVGASTYTFQQNDLTVTFRGGTSEGLPFGSFPGIGTYFS